MELEITSFVVHNRSLLDETGKSGVSHHSAEWLNDVADNKMLSFLAVRKPYTFNCLDVVNLWWNHDKVAVNYMIVCLFSGSTCVIFAMMMLEIKENLTKSLDIDSTLYL